jgi:Icc-related predicted phosphoesterase
MGGDMTSKVMVPIVREPEGGYTANFRGKQVKISEEGLPGLKKQIRQHCYLPYVCSKDEVERLSQDQEYVEKVFEDLEVEMVNDWLSLIPKKTPDVRVIIHPGNDDKFILDDVLRKSPNIVFAEEAVVQFDDLHEAACVGWSNPTPWHSPRECTEEQLLEKLEKTVSQLKSIEGSCFCFHVPPYNSTIDMAPKLDANLRPVYEGGRPAFIPVGSTSVRKVIEKYQPLLGLHGHIHESPGLVKIGKTQCINPGSEYSEGILRAYIIELEGGRAKRLQRLEG